MIARLARAVCRREELAARLLTAAIAFLLAAPLAAQDTTRTTRAGVYTAEQATRGRDTYVMMCKSCHTPASHTGTTFASWWERKPVAELFGFISTRMPKNDPGSLSPEEYADLVAYLLKMNAMPAGPLELPPDSAALAAIRIETAPVARPVRKPAQRPTPHATKKKTASRPPTPE